jgi:hypothetical protein
MTSNENDLYAGVTQGDGEHMFTGRQLDGIDRGEASRRQRDQDALFASFTSEVISVIVIGPGGCRRRGRSGILLRVRDRNKQREDQSKQGQQGRGN